MAAALSSSKNPGASTPRQCPSSTAAKDRHCAFCLTLVPAEKVLFCWKCRRRAFCSKECRERDWNWNHRKGKKGGAARQQLGQGHKNWCSLAAGEEDLDWKVTEIEGKGLGLVALRDFPAGFRIMVEAGQPTPFSHPKTSELMPLTNVDAEGKLKPATESELRTKFALNGLRCCDEDEEKEVLCLRIARANHSCFPNADHVYDNERKVKILYSVKAVSAGEEICISYINFTSFSAHSNAGLSAEQRHSKLQSRWGFDCPSNAPCRDKKVQKRIAVATRIYDQIPTQAKSLSTIDQALGGVRALLQVCDSLGLPQLVKVAALYDGFQIAVTRTETLGEARAYINQLCGLAAMIYHPEDARLREYLNWRKDVLRHHAFLIMDGGGMGECPIA